MTSQQLSNNLSELKISIASAKGVKQRITEQISTLQEKIEKCNHDVKIKKEAHLLMLAFIAHRREAAIATIEETGTYGLRAIYNDDRKLVFITNEEKKSTAAFKMEVGIESNLNGKRILTGILDERGGGLAETSSFSLRKAALEWSGYLGPLIIDEAWKSLSDDEKIEQMAELLSEYVKVSGRQVIFSTHKLDVFGKFADNIIHVRQESGLSYTYNTHGQEI
jgi:hypothetical protein